MRDRVVILLDLLAMAVASLAFADETMPLLTVGTNTYKNLTIFKVSATDIYFNCDKGLSNVKLKDLDLVLQRHFNFNSTNAAVIEQKQHSDNTRYFQMLSRPSAATSSGEDQPPPGGQIEPGTGKMIWAMPFLDQKSPPLFIEKWLTPEPDGRGKFVLVDFWQPASLPCRAVVPLLNAMQHDFAGKLTVISITRQSEDVVKQANDVKFEHYLAVDTQGRTEKSLGVAAAPHVILIDPHGVIRWEGYPFLQGYELTEKIVADVISKYSQ